MASAAAWLAALSTAGRLADAQPVPIQRVTISERWDGDKWIELRLVWDGDKITLLSVSYKRQ